MSSERKIQQQYFARAREGVFRSNEGLDTVAKSPSLDGNFIKKTLHPFCVYFPPQELVQRGEQELSRFPESLTVFHADSGELVIGRSQFAGTDFTGQRDTIFVHNYVVPKERKEEVLRSGFRIFQINHFQTEYDIQEGKVLPELDDIPADSQSHLERQQNILDRLGIDDNLFKQLLGAVMASISSNKKVYIALDVDVTESAIYAKKLTEILFHFLPYELRRHFGFTTYYNEPQGKKFIDVMFVEKGSIRANDRSLDKDFVFDFPNGRFVNAERASQDHFYLNFAWSCRERPDALAEFFSFAEEALQGREAAEKLAPSTYHKLCALFQVSRGLKSLYERNKDGLLYSILDYLDDGAQANKQKLYQMFYQLVGDEVSNLNSGNIVSVEYLQAMIAYCRIADTRTQQEFVGHLVNFMFTNWKNNEDPNYSIQTMQELQQQPELFAAVVEKMHSEDRYYRVFEDYFQARAESINTVRGIQEEIEFWKKYTPQVVASTFFLQQILLKVQRVLEKSSDILNNGKQLYAFIQTLDPTSRDIEIFKENLELAIAICMLDALELDQVTAADIDKLQFLVVRNPGKGKKELEPKDKEKLRILGTVSLILNGDGQKESEILSKLDGMDPEAFDQTRRMLQKLLRAQVYAANFKKVSYAFYRRPKDQDADDEEGLGVAARSRSSGKNNKGSSSRKRESGIYNYREMLAYVHSAAQNSETVFEFISWCSSSSKLEESYKAAIRDYFEYEGQGAFKSKSIRKKIKSVKNAELRKLLDEIRLTQSGFLMKLLTGKNKGIGISLIVVVFTLAIAGGTVVVLGQMKKDKGTPPLPTTIPTAEQSESPTPSLDSGVETPSSESSNPSSTAPSSPDGSSDPGASSSPSASSSPITSTTPSASGVPPSGEEDSQQ